MKELVVLADESQQKRVKAEGKYVFVSVFQSVCACVFIAFDIVQGQSYLSWLKCDFLCRNGYMLKTISSPNLHTVLSGDNSLPALLFKFKFPKLSCPSC